MDHVSFNNLMPDDVCFAYVTGDRKVWAIVKITPNEVYKDHSDKQECIILTASFHFEQERGDRYIDRDEVVGLYILNESEQLLAIVTENL